MASKTPANQDLTLPEPTFSPEEQAIASLAAKAGQSHLFEGWEFGKNDDKLKGLLAQLGQLDSQYPGGILAYSNKAKQMLSDKLLDKNPFEGYIPHVPKGARLITGSKEFLEMEKKGLEAARYAGFVLVAGGLGERLGYSGIKVALPIDLATGECYLRRYCQHILALQASVRAVGGKDAADVELPLFIMTSGDTHAKTMELLKSNKNFGMKPTQITVVPQEKVPALCDNDAKFATQADGWGVQTKPHGHGDVHLVMHQSGTVSRWEKQGVKWLLFFQDTNGLVFHSVPAALGVSASRGFVMNSITVPRKAGEAVGGICRLTTSDAMKKEITINVEYSDISALLKATVSPEGDVADESGFSPYPGNINVLVVNLPVYAKALATTSGIIPEFINPKYTDSVKKTVFKKPTRLECMMQDLPKLIAKVDREKDVGFTQLDRWICFSAVKNSLEGGAGKQKVTGFAESAASGESDTYRYYRKAMNAAGVAIAVDAGKAEWTPGIRVNSGAMVVLKPSVAMTSMGSIQKMFPTPGKVCISHRSTLIVEGDVTIDELVLDGALAISAIPGAKVHLKKLTCKNAGYILEKVDTTDLKVPEVLRIRGYNISKKACMTYLNAKPSETLVIDE